MTIRFAKIVCVAALALYMALVAFGNVTDYSTNFAFVLRTLNMDDVQGGEAIRWRAATSPTLHQLAYLAIIATEIAVAALTLFGAFAMLRAAQADARTFGRAKNFAIIGLTLCFALFEGGFIAIGGEWFGMWRAPADANAVPSAFRIAIAALGVLIFVALENDGL